MSGQQQSPLIDLLMANDQEISQASRLNAGLSPGSNDPRQGLPPVDKALNIRAKSCISIASGLATLPPENYSQFYLDEVKYHIMNLRQFYDRLLHLDNDTMMNLEYIYTELQAAYGRMERALATRSVPTQAFTRPATPPAFQPNAHSSGYKANLNATRTIPKEFAPVNSQPAAQAEQLIDLEATTTTSSSHFKRPTKEDELLKFQGSAADWPVFKALFQ